MSREFLVQDDGSEILLGLRNIYGCDFVEGDRMGFLIYLQGRRHICPQCGDILVYNYATWWQCRRCRVWCWVKL